MTLRLTEKQAKVLGFVPPPDESEPPAVEAPVRTIVHNLTGFGFALAFLGGWLVGFMCGLVFTQ